MKILDEKTGKIVEIQNEVLWDLKCKFHLLRALFFDFFDMGVPATVNGELCVVRFDFLDSVFDSIFDIDCTTLDDFVNQLFIKDVQHLNKKLCEEEDLDVVGVDFNFRQYPIRKLLKLKIYETKKK